MAYSMVVSGGNVYVAGYTDSTNFPGTSGGAQPAYGGGYYDAFVSLLSADLKQLVQSTYLGGNGDDSCLFHGRFRGECLCGGVYRFNQFSRYQRRCSACIWWRKW